MSATPVRRAASVWVAGVGAVLLFVAAALFVAVQWKHLPDLAKLGIILAVTVSFIVGAFGGLVWIFSAEKAAKGSAPIAVPE